MGPESAAGSCKRRSAFTIVTRGAVPLLLLALSILLAAGGSAALPIWIAGTGIRLGATPETTLRILIALQSSLALGVLLLPRWSRSLAIGALVFLAFAAIAELSAVAGIGGDAVAFVSPAAVLAIVGVLLPGVFRAPRPIANPHLSTAWPALGAIAIVTLATAVVARLPLDRGEAPPETTAFGGRIVELTPETWIGGSLPATGLPAHLPELTPLTIEGRSVVVLYSPRCGGCHDLFRTWLSDADLPFRVIAVEVPPEPSALLLPSDQPERVDCPSCVDLVLPSGPLWLIQPPVLLTVVDGLVAGVAMRPDQVGDLLEPWLADS